ncbi:conserved membrane hypothetical protein [Gammaproteobacteria bacterium]
MGYWRLLLLGVLLTFAIFLTSGTGGFLAGFLALAMLAWILFQGVRSLLFAGMYRGVWRQGIVLGGGVLLAFILSWIFLRWTAVLFLVGSVAVALLSYAFIKVMRRMALPNSVIIVTTDVSIRSPLFRHWGRYTLEAEVKSDVALAKGKTQRLHTRRMRVKVHREDFPDGKMVDACHNLVRDFIERERQMLLKHHPESQLLVDEGYSSQIRNLPLPTTVRAVTDTPNAA